MAPPHAARLLQAAVLAAALLGGAALLPRGRSDCRRRRPRRGTGDGSGGGGGGGGGGVVVAASERPPREGFERVLFVEMGFGCDQHGQNPTKACVRAARNAIEFNSLPAIGDLVPGGYDGMLLAVDVAVPARYRDAVDVDAIAAVFPYGNVDVTFQDGGAVFASGIALPALGDANDDAIVAVVAVTVGY